MANPTRCSGCGKSIETGKVIRIANGKVKKGVYSEGKEWGMLHEECFNRSIDSPAATLDEVRRQARESTAA